MAQRPLGHTIIAVGKGLKCVFLVGVGIAAIVAAHGDPQSELMQVADALRIDPGGRHLNHLLEVVTRMSPEKLDALGIGSFVYAALFAVEGVGLWLQKHWAEILTIVITVSFIPFEIFEIAHHASIAKVITLVLNVAAVVYLVAREVKRRSKAGGRASSRGRRSGTSPSRASAAT